MGIWWTGFYGRDALPGNQLTVSKHNRVTKNYLVHGKMSKINFSILIPLACDGATVTPSSLQNGIFFLATWCFNSCSFSLRQQINQLTVHVSWAQLECWQCAHPPPVSSLDFLKRSSQCEIYKLNGIGWFSEKSLKMLPSDVIFYS